MTATGELSPAWRGEDVGYEAVHARLRRLYGPASEHDCLCCGEPARDWAYTHTCPNEKASPEGFAYSADLERYAPLCRRCHVHLDRPVTQQEIDEIRREMAAA